MISPEKKWPGTAIDLINAFYDGDGFAVDPDTVALRLISPDGTQTSFSYAGGTITKPSQGNYLCTVIPNMGGVWYFRWEATTGVYPLTPEGDFVVQVSPFIDGRRDAYRT